MEGTTLTQELLIVEGGDLIGGEPEGVDFEVKELTFLSRDEDVFDVVVLLCAIVLFELLEGWKELE